MKITLVTPVLNGGRFLARALRSVRDQNDAELEYIVCDGGSTDETLALLRDHRDLITHLISEPDQGMYDALRKGFGLATGEILGWLNADDLLMPWCLSCVREYFRLVPTCEWITGTPSLIDENDRVVWTAQVAPRYRRSWIAAGWYSGWGLGPIQQESTFFRRSLYERAGGVNASLRLAGDFDLWRRMAAFADLHQLGTVIAGFRVHEHNLTAQLPRYYKEVGVVKIPGGKVIGAVYSFLAFLLARWRRRPRLDDAVRRRLQG